MTISQLLFSKIMSFFFDEAICWQKSPLKIIETKSHYYSKLCGFWAPIYCPPLLTYTAQPNFKDNTNVVWTRD